MESKKYQLPKEFATKWVEALRTKKYRQGNGRLKTNGDCYCCLGVACAISGATDRQIGGYAYIPLKSKINAPKALKGMANGSGLVYKLSTMNDSGHSFLLIADWIEANVEFI